MTSVPFLCHLCIRWTVFFFLFLLIFKLKCSVQFSHSLSHVWLFATPWTASCQTCLSFTNSRSLLKLRSIESVMPSNHFILCHPLLLLPSIFPCIRIFSNELALLIRWPNYWSLSFNISPSSEHPGLTSWILYNWVLKMWPVWLRPKYLIVFNFN